LPPETKQVQQESVFFFEKKKQKTFIPWLCRLSPAPSEGIKVFWFFFSKKNYFLPLLA